MTYSLPGYDDWKTTAPEDDWGVCPDCGASQEDAEYEDLYFCGCGCRYTDEQARPDPTDDEPILPGDE